MQKGTVKYIIMLLFSIFIIVLLSLYISKQEDIINNDNVKKESSRVIKQDHKEFIYTKEIKSDDVYKFKYYGEEVDNKKNIYVDIYINDKYLIGLNYIDEYEVDNKYKNIIEEINLKENTLTNENGYTIINISRYNKIYDSTYILIKDKNIIDIYNHKINKCNIKEEYNSNINEVIINDDNNVTLVSIKYNENGFYKESISYDKDLICEDGGLE